MSGSDLDGVAHELYGLSPEEFTAARDARSAAARKGGDRQLASELKGLRRPSTSAWLANQLARDHPEELDRLLSLGRALRDAQERLSGPELRRLSGQRRQMLEALAGAAAAIAEQSRRRLGPEVERELTGTFEAALADPAASDALAAGRLTSALASSGLGGGFPAPGEEGSRPPAPKSPGPKPVPKPPAGPKADRPKAGPNRDPEPSSRRSGDVAAVRAARAAAVQADREMKRRSLEVARIERRRDQLADQISRMEAGLRELRAERAEVTSSLRAAERALAGAAPGTKPGRHKTK